MKGKLEGSNSMTLTQITEGETDSAYIYLQLKRTKGMGFCIDPQDRELNCCQNIKWKQAISEWVN